MPGKSQELDDKVLCKNSRTSPEAAALDKKLCSLTIYFTLPSEQTHSKGWSFEFRRRRLGDNAPFPSKEHIAQCGWTMDPEMPFPDWWEALGGEGEAARKRRYPPSNRPQPRHPRSLSPSLIRGQDFYILNLGPMYSAGDVHPFCQRGATRGASICPTHSNGLSHWFE